MVFQHRLVVVEDGQGRAGLDVEVVGGSCVGLKLNRGFVGAPPQTLPTPLMAPRVQRLTDHCTLCTNQLLYKCVYKHYLFACTVQ
jgi:hypothetical protein